MVSYLRVKELLAYDQATGELIWLFTRSPGRRRRVAGTATKSGYRIIRIDGEYCLAHRVVWLWMTGAFPDGEIDHINRIRNDNRWSNLREATRSQNSSNKEYRLSHDSNLRGAVWNKNCRKWQASITVNGNKKYLGLFPTKELAHGAYKDAARNVFGEFARFE